MTLLNTGSSKVYLCTKYCNYVTRHRAVVLGLFTFMDCIVSFWVEVILFYKMLPCILILVNAGGNHACVRCYWGQLHIFKARMITLSISISVDHISVPRRQSEAAGLTPPDVGLTLEQAPVPWGPWVLHSRGALALPSLPESFPFTSLQPMFRWCYD